MYFVCKLLLWAILISLSSSGAKAHEAHSGFQYPHECCSDGDCDEAKVAVRQPDGSLLVTTTHGTATFPANFEHRDSPDGKIHACFVGTRLYCLFLASGTSVPERTRSNSRWIDPISLPAKLFAKAGPAQWVCHGCPWPRSRRLMAAP